MLAEDLDGDGNLDLILSGNDFGAEIMVGREDAFNGLVLKGDGKGNFTPLSILQSGLYLPGDSRAFVKLRSAKGKVLLASSEHNAAVKLFEVKKPRRLLPVGAKDLFAMIQNKDGSARKEEFYYGSSFLSQSARYIMLSDQVVSVRITDQLGKTRSIDLK